MADHLALGDVPDRLVHGEVAQREHLQDLERGQHGVEGRLESGEDKPAEGIPDENHALLRRGLHQRARRDLGPDHPESPRSDQLLQDAAGGDGNPDRTGGLCPRHQQSHDGQGQLVGDQVALVIHQEQLLGPGIQHEPEVGAENADDLAELFQRLLKLLGGLDDAGLVHVGVERDDFTPQLAQDVGKDRRGAAIGVVDHHLGGTGADGVLVDEAQNSLFIILDVILGEAESSRVLHLGPAEVLAEEEPLDPLLAAGGEVHPPLVEELDVDQRGLEGRAPDVHPRHCPVLAHLIADHGDGRDAQVVDVHPGREESADDGPVDETRGPVRVPAGADERVLPERGAEGGPQLDGELGRDLDVAQPRDAVGPKERARPPVAPDQAGREDGPVLHQLLGPDLDVGLDHRPFADAAAIADQGPLEQPGARLDLAAASHHVLGQGRARTDSDLVPEHGVGDNRPVLHHAVVPDDAVGDARVGLHPGILPDQDGPPKARGEIHPAAIIQPDRLVQALHLASGDLHPYPSGKDVLMGEAVLHQVSHIPPVALGHIAVEPPPLSHHQGEKVLAEIEIPPGGDQVQHGGLQHVDPGVHRIAEHLAPGRLLQEAADPAVRLGDDDAVLERVLHPREQDGEIRIAVAVKGDGRSQVEVGEHVAADDQERTVEEGCRVLHRPHRPVILDGGDVRHLHPERRPVPEVVLDQRGLEMEQRHKVRDPVPAEQVHDVLHHGLVGHGNHGLWDSVGQRPQTGPEPPGHDHGLHLPALLLASQVRRGASTGSPLHYRFGLRGLSSGFGGTATAGRTPAASVGR